MDSYKQMFSSVLYLSILRPIAVPLSTLTRLFHIGIISQLRLAWDFPLDQIYQKHVTHTYNTRDSRTFVVIASAYSVIKE